MKRKSFLISSSMLFLTMATLVGCGSSSSGGDEKILDKDITVWVGSESVPFYKKKVEEYLEKSNVTGLSIKVDGSDIGSAGGVMANDNTTCADIVSIAHDNIGKLSQASLIAPIIDEGLLDQIRTDNPESFVEVIQNYLGEDAAKQQDPKQYYTFAVPYISQALFLYYDTRYVNSEQAKTFEGLELAAKDYDSKYGADGTRSFLVTGTDGYNFSFPVLARRDPDGENIPTSRIYENFDKEACYEQSNDQVAIMRWLQRSNESKNGILLKPGSSWTIPIQEHKALASIGGAWQYNAFKSAVGDGNVGCAPIPTFTLTADDVKGITDVRYPNADYIPEELRGTVDKAPVAGTTYRGGSFVDCKCFVINMASILKWKNKGPRNADDIYYKLCDLIKFLSSVEVQKESFIQALNVPAFNGAEEYIASLEGTGKVDQSVLDMAKAQTSMNNYGIAQPFSTAKLNTYYYQNSAPDFYVQGITKTAPEEYYDTTTIEGIRRTLFKMEYVWRNGKRPDSEKISSTLPAATDKQA